MPNYDVSKEEQKKAFRVAKRIKDNSGSKRKPRIRKKKATPVAAKPQPKPKNYKSNNAAIRSVMNKAGVSMSRLSSAAKMGARVGGPLGFIGQYRQFKRMLDNAGKSPLGS
jgi:hypothetical protein